MVHLPAISTTRKQNAAPTNLLIWYGLHLLSPGCISRWCHLLLVHLMVPISVPTCLSRSICIPRINRASPLSVILNADRKNAPKMCCLDPSQSEKTRRTLTCSPHTPPVPLFVSHGRSALAVAVPPAAAMTFRSLSDISACSFDISVCAESQYLSMMSRSRGNRAKKFVAL